MRFWKKNPSKLMRDVDPLDRERYAKRYKTWTLIAKYNYSRRIAKTLTLTPEQKTEAYKEFKPRMPNWQMTAEALYASKNKLYKLTSEETNKALLIQDDRVMPDPFPEKWTMGLMSHHDLREYPRKANAEKEQAMLVFWR